MTQKTQGTEIFFLSDEVVTPLGCPTNVNGIDAKISPRDRTPLGAGTKTSEPGVKSPGAVSITVNYDPADYSHRFLRGFYSSRHIFTLAVGLSDGTTVPSVNNGEFDYPSNRSWIELTGYLTGYPLSAKTGAVYQTSLSFQLIEEPVIMEKTSVGMDWQGDITWQGGIKWSA